MLLNNPPTDQIISQLKKWSTTELGKRLLTQENITLNKLITKHSREIGIQVSFMGVNNLTQIISSNKKKFLLTSDIKDSSNSIAAIIDPENMPIIPDIVDLFILQHILEIYPKPKDIIQEAANALTSSGKLIICGFNPTSFINLFKLVNNNLKTTFHDTNFISANKLCYWLKKYNFHVITIKYHGFLFSNILYNMKLGKKIESILTKKNLSMGFCYTILATKQKYCKIEKIDFFDDINSRLYPNEVPKPNLGKTFE